MQRWLIVFLLAAAPVAFAETIDLRPCLTDAPSTPYDLPSCADYELHSALIESAIQGDASAIALLRTRYVTAFTHAERHRIARALLSDSSIWNDILAEAELAVRFAEVDGKVPAAYDEWCAQRGLNPSQHRGVLYSALAVAASDERVIPLLKKARRSKDANVAVIVDQVYSKRQ